MIASKWAEDGKRRGIASAIGVLCLTTLTCVNAESKDGWMRVTDAASPAVVQVGITTTGGFIGVGSGAIISPNGYVLTCRHVLTQSERRLRQQDLLGTNSAGLAVRLEDRTTVLPAYIEFGHDNPVDIAVLTIETEASDRPFPWLELGDSDTLRKLDEVLFLGFSLPHITLGCPHQAVPTRGTHASVGVIEGRKEVQANGGALELLIHTCNVDGGSSGGPLLNADGLIVGVVHAAYGWAEQFKGALPVNWILENAASLLHVLPSGELPERHPPVGVSIRKFGLGRAHDLCLCCGQPLPQYQMR